MNDLKKQILSLIDLTSLNNTDTDAVIDELCEKAITPLGSVAAVCVYPRFVARAKKNLLGSGVKVATVANFPQGEMPIDEVLDSIQQSLSEGAQEIDVVFPYARYQLGGDFIQQCKALCGDDIVLKVILETGQIPGIEAIGVMSRDVLLAGADFLKTSTGKIAIGATLPAAKAMLEAIKVISLQQPGRVFGFKASGGVRTVAQAVDYLTLAQTIMGPDWATPATFRFGASQLLAEIVSGFGKGVY